MLISHNGNNIEFTIEYKKRKTTKIYIETTGLIKVRAPKGADEEKIIQAVKDNAEKILEKLKKIDELYEKPKEKTYLEGEMFLYQGKEYPISIQIDENVEKCRVSFSGNMLEIISMSSDEDVLRDSLKNFYYKECLKVVKARITQYQQLINVKHKNIKVEDSKARWGSCSSTKNLTFNYKLIMAPEDVLDYIVVHELCHLIMKRVQNSMKITIKEILIKKKMTID
jgi:predicted metal-dependent hydrolase